MDRLFSRPDKYHMKEIKMDKSNDTGDKAVKNRNKPGGQGRQEEAGKKACG